MAARRFPPPWTVEELDACFVVIDSAEQKLAYVYFEEEPGRRSAAKLLTRDEVRRIACDDVGSRKDKWAEHRVRPTWRHLNRDALNEAHMPFDFLELLPFFFVAMAPLLEF